MNLFSIAFMDKTKTVHENLAGKDWNKNEFPNCKSYCAVKQPAFWICEYSLPKGFRQKTRGAICSGWYEYSCTGQGVGLNDFWDHFQLFGSAIYYF